MTYLKAECPECRQKMMASDGVIPPHTIRGTQVPCDGAGETIEFEASGEVDEGQAAETPIAETDKQSTPSEETTMPQKVEVDLKRLEELAATGTSKARAANELGIIP